MDELISRRAAIDALARMMPRSYTPDGSHPADEEIFRAQEVFADCIEVLEILPSAQPEREKGKWERHFSRPNVYADLCWHCSVCGGSFAYDWANKWNFCPDCGAKMDGKEAEDE